MAKSRTYNRDARGRFAGGGGSGGGRKSAAKLPSPTKRTTSGKVQRRGLLTQRSSLARSQAKLKAKDSADRSLTGQFSLRAQKAAVTRAKNKLAAAQKTGRVRLKARAGVVRASSGKAVTRAGLNLKKNADGKYAWFSGNGKQMTGAYRTKAEAMKSPEIEARQQLSKSSSKSQAKMSSNDFQDANRKWGKLSDKKIAEMADRDESAARSLQNAREFTGAGTRRSGAAMANQAAREAFDSARQARRYLAERRRRR